MLDYELAALHDKSKSKCMVELCGQNSVMTEIDLDGLAQRTSVADLKRTTGNLMNAKSQKKGYSNS